jgi:SAM-dependent methyltransferase
MVDENPWEGNADIWSKALASDGEGYRDLVIEPATLDFIKSLHGQTVLDVGCGDGAFTRSICKALSPSRVIAIDKSERMIALAQQADGPDLPIEYRVADICAFSVPSETLFDTALFFMSIMNIADLDSAIRVVARCVRDSGQIVIAMLHPCFSTGINGWLKKKHDGQKSFYVSRYLAEEPFDKHWAFKPSPRSTEDAFMLRDLRYSRTLTTYMSVFRTYGFCIADMREPKPSADTLSRHDWLAPYSEHIPLSLLLRLKLFDQS